MEETTRRLPRERELVLAPNEYAWVLDTTKGHINCYVGPNKTSLAQTDQPVIFDEIAKRFVPAEELSTAIQLFATAPENWYVVLKNPALDNGHPRIGVASGLAELQVGKKVIVKGPASFALWPGQIARVVEGHRLQSSQYLVARIYDKDLAAKDPAAVFGAGSEAKATTFEVGQKIVIPGDTTGFYVPPNGVEIVADDDGRLIREAVTLQRLEYCVLVKENGKKRTVRGEAVVFPAPDERFVEEGNKRRFRAIELSSTSGLHLKVIAPFVDDGVAHKEGDELFLTGESTRLYFPREEHAIVKPPGAQFDNVVHHAVAIPAGEGRYVLDKQSGDVRLIAGPRMFLADPRIEVIIRRALSDRESMLMFPGNDEALQLNRALRAGTAPLQKAEKTPVAVAPPALAKTHEGIDSFSRSFHKPQTLVLDTRFDGAVGIDVWSGYAVCVKDRRGQRRVVQGPQTVLLAFDETLESLALSTGTPKTTQKLLTTVFLKVQGNQVSDVVDVVCKDLVRAHIKVTFRVSFEGDAQAWFIVDNYVKLLCDHAASIIKGKARKVLVRDLRNDIVELVRDAVLGEKSESGRKGLAFKENGLRVFDVEVHACDIVDDDVKGLLDEAQQQAVRSAVDVAARESGLLDHRRTEEIARQLLNEDQQTKLLSRRLDDELELQVQEAEKRRIEHRRALLEQKAAADLLASKGESEIKEVRLQFRIKESVEDLKELDRRQQLEMTLLAAQTDARVRQAQALSPELSAALTRLGDSQLLSSLSASFGELAAVEGRGLLETARKFLDFAPQAAFPVLRAPQPRAAEGGKKPDSDAE